MKKHFTMLVVTLLLSCSSLLAQNTNINDLISIDGNFVISLNQTEDTAIAQHYELDISSLDFKSATDLAQFCETFSLDLHTLTGNFNNQTILVQFDQEKINKRELTIDDVNQYFNRMSNRMTYFQNQLNN